MTRGRPGPRDTARHGRPAETWLIDRPRLWRAPADDLKVALAYPASYEVAMSSLGFHAALAAFARQPGVSCERAFLDRSLGDVGSSYESGTPLSGCDVVAFSVSFEADFLGVVSLLNAAGIPLKSTERSDGHPLVVMGGVCASLNPEPVAPFLDAVLVGDADSLVPPLVASAASSRGEPRTGRLEVLSGLPGFYVPRLYEVERNADGTVARFSSPAGAPLPIRPALDPDTAPPAVSAALSGGAHFDDMLLIEVSRGCAWDCRFCAAGHVYHPPRFRSGTEIVEAIRRPLGRRARVGLVSAALVDHPEFREILTQLVDLGVELNVSSLRLERIDDEVAGLLARGGVRTVTVAPETGREDLRAILGKGVSDERILAATASLAGAGIESLKLYFMLGVPGETDEDMEAIVDLVREIRSAFVAGRRGIKLAVSASAFVPKPRTPFQWLPMADERTIRGRTALLRRRLARERIYRFTSAGPREAVREGVLARGGRELGEALVLSAVDRLPWKAALRRTGVSPGAIVWRERGEDEVFPWEIVEVGVPRGRLLASLSAARSLIASRRGEGPEGGAEQRS